MKKINKILIAGGLVIVIIAGSIFAYNKFNKDDIELGKIEYENRDIKPKPQENKSNESNEDNSEIPENQPEIEDKNKDLKADSKDLEAADNADFGQYPFEKFKKENAKLLTGPDVGRFQNIAAEHTNNFIKAVEKAREDGQTGMTEDMQKELNIFFMQRDTSKVANIIKDVYNDGKELYVNPEDVIIFQNEDPTFETNNPTLIGVRCKCAGDEIIYYLQGLGVLNENAESFIPFATVQN